MPRGYWIAHVDVTDPEVYKKYLAANGLAFAKYGGRFLVRGGDIRHLEGKLPLDRLVVLEFPTMDAAQRFYDSKEYAPLLKLRLASTKSDLVLVPGV